MKKEIVSLLIGCLMMGMAFSGCGSQSGEVTEEQTETEVVEDTAEATEEPVETEEEVTDEEVGEYPANPMEEACGIYAFDSYDDVISHLTNPMAYAYVKVMGYDEEILLVACGETAEDASTYEWDNGENVTITAYPYLPCSDGKIRCGSVLSSETTAAPISIDENGVLMYGGHSSVSCDVLNGNEDALGIMALAYVYVSYDTDGNATYGGFIRETNSLEDDGTEVAADDEATVNEYFEKLSAATPIEFTIVE